ncbi:hypothetical protein KUCAC02_019458, partial [Chaenocephalus aceratus]
SLASFHPIHHKTSLQRMDHFHACFPDCLSAGWKLPLCTTVSPRPSVRAYCNYPLPRHTSPRTPMAALKVELLAAVRQDERSVAGCPLQQMGGTGRSGRFKEPESGPTGRGRTKSGAGYLMDGAALAGLISQQIGAFQRGVGSAWAVAHAAQAGSFLKFLAPAAATEKDKVPPPNADD